MRRKAYRVLLYILILLTVALGLRALRTEMTLSKKVQPGAKVVAETLYTLCKHTVSKQVQLPVRDDLTVSQVESSYMGESGWSPSFQGKELRLTRTDDGLCPVCRKKSHLATKGDYVTVVQGPHGVAGDLLRVTRIRVDSLPSDLKEQLLQGRLNLPDEKVLLQMLDSLDENSTR